MHSNSFCIYYNVVSKTIRMPAQIKFLKLVPHFKALFRGMTFNLYLGRKTGTKAYDQTCGEHVSRPRRERGGGYSL